MKRIISFLLGLISIGSWQVFGQTILFPVGSGPFASDINLQTNTLVVVNRNSNSVSIVDLASNTIKKTVTVGTGPTSVAINPTTNRAVVTNFGSNNVSIVDLAGAAVLATVAVGNSPRAVAIDTQHNVAIVANLNGNNISLIDLNNNTSILPQPVAVGTHPIAVAYNPVNNTALVANFDGGTLAVLDLTLRVVTSTVSVGLKPIAIALNLETKQAVVANQDTNDVTIVSLTDNSVLHTVSVGTQPFSVGVDTKTNIAAVVSNQNRSITLINLSGDTPTKFTTVISNIGDNPTSLSVNPNTNTALVTNPTSDSVVITPLGFVNNLLFAFDIGDVRSNLGINNLGSTEANVEIDLIDQNGKLLKTASTKVPSRALKHITKISQFLYGTSSPTSTRGFIKLVSDQPISSFLSLITYGTNDASVVLGHSAGFPKLVVNAATNVAPYRSQLMLLNLGSTSASVTITAYDNAAGTVLATKTGISIPAGGFYFSEDIMTDLGLAGKFGPLQIESLNLQSVIGATLLSNANHTNGLFEAVPIQ